MADELKKIDLTPMTKETMLARARKSFPWKALFVPLGILAVILLVIGLMLLPLRGVIAKSKDVVSS